MSDNVAITPGSGATIATDNVGARHFQLVKLAFGADGAAALVALDNGLPVTLTGGVITVTGPLTDAQMRAAPVAVTGPLTDQQLRATPVAVTGGLTDTQLRATPVPVSGSVAVTGALTDAELRAAALVVSGPLTDSQLRASAVPVSGPLTDTQLRAAAVPVSASALPLPSGAATEATLGAMNAKLPPAGQATMAASQPVVIASNQTAIPTAEQVLVLTGAAAQTAVVNNILESAAGAAGTSVDSFRAASVQVVSTGTGGTFIFEQSNDGTNWVALPVFNAALLTGAPIAAAITATASSIIYTFPVRCRFVRLRIATLITGGSIQAFSRFSTDPYAPAISTMAQPTAANLQATVAGTVTVGASANAIGDVGLQARANATGAASIHHMVSAASTNVAQIKATAGRVVGWCLSNNSASWRYVKLHNVASATAGAGVVLTIGIPPNNKAECTHAVGIGFATAISRSIVTGAADADATATGVAEVVGDIFFA